MGPGRAGMAPTSGPGWVRNTVKQSTWRIWTGRLRTQDGTWTGQGSDPGEGLDGTPRDSNTLLGLTENPFATPHALRSAADIVMLLSGGITVLVFQVNLSWLAGLTSATTVGMVGTFKAGAKQQQALTHPM